MFHRRIAPAMLWACLLFAPGVAQDWPMFRGPQASGVADGRALPAEWDAVQGINLQWKTAIPGLGHSSPIVWGNFIFVTTAIDPNSKTPFLPTNTAEMADATPMTWRIYCLDKRSGKILWRRDAHRGVPRSKRHPKASQVNQTPVTDGKYVAALMGSEGLYVYDLKGKLLWKRDLGVLSTGWFGHLEVEWGPASSPIIYRDMVIVQFDGHTRSFLAAWNLKTGKQVWRVDRGEITSWSTPAVYEVGGRAELVANGGHFIRGYDPATGKELWRFDDHHTEVKQQVPIFAKNMIIVTGGYPPGRPILAFKPGANGDISLQEGQEINQSLAWRTPKGGAYTPSPIAYGDQLYICSDNGVFSSYKLATGELIYQARLPSSFSASPVAGDGKLFMASEDGDLYVVRAGPKFELLATNPMGEPLMATPAISDGLIIIRGRDHLFAVAPAASNRPSTSEGEASERVSGK
ncbi:MAG TPA: PQQ-binding-like beta-propeller repeat protein [Blastocatellia bacterium]